MNNQQSASAIFGLVLAGGRSKRMGRDKARLFYNGQTQLACTLNLLSACCSQTFVSLRMGQTLPAEAAHASPIYDRFGEIGPLGGILSALDQHPAHPWLVVAVDLPFLDQATLDYLFAHRDPSCPFTAYRSDHDGLPEPLCAIYEPSAKPILLDALKNQGNRCPRKILIDTKTRLLDLPNPRALDNINTPREHEEALTRLQS